MRGRSVSVLLRRSFLEQRYNPHTHGAHVAVCQSLLAAFYPGVHHDHTVIA